MSLFCFKQFNVLNEKSPLKVNTDGVLLGAWADISKAKTILDVGTGNGTIALMCAQRNPKAKIWGIDISENAIEEAQLNFAHSSFHHRMMASQTDFLKLDDSYRFDAILSNPPYFEHHHKTQTERNYARQEVELNLSQLLCKSANLLHKNGLISLILPYDRLKDVHRLSSEFNLNLIALCKVKGSPTSKIKRMLITLSKDDLPFTENEIVLEIKRGVKHPSFDRLTKDFYL